jgi:hypothetical protein
MPSSVPGERPRTRSARRGTSAQEEADLVRAALEHYAHRGIFRGFGTTTRTAARVEFTFSWFRDVTFRVAFDPRRRTLTFVDMLPGIPARSVMDRGLRAFVQMHTSAAVPEHRRVDRRRVVVSVVNRAGSESLTIAFRTKDVANAVR